jgi:uroporphyrinogen decarboxylase
VLPRFPFGIPDEQNFPSLDDYLAATPIDPSAPDILAHACDEQDGLFLSVQDALARGAGDDLAVFVHAWGVFELSQFLYEKAGQPGTEEALMNMLAEKEKSARMYMKLAAWSAACVENAIVAGADVVELSDDWGQQDTMMFSPKLWRELVFPATKLIVDTARRHGVPVIVHTDGDVSLVLEGIRELGVAGLHPVQESAGMSFERTRTVLGKDVCIMGGLDTITALPIMSADEIRTEVQRVFGALKPSGPFIFSGSHMFQDDAPLDVIEAAYEEAGKLAAF